MEFHDNREEVAMTGAPLVLVVARHLGRENAERVASSLGRQTYSNLKLVFARRHEEEALSVNGGALDICSTSDLLAFVEHSGADRVLFWPEDALLKAAAIEKLVLALEVAPDQNGVADAARAGNGLWLARRTEAMDPLIGLWLESQVEWVEESLRREAALFFIDENLLEGAPAVEVSSPEGVMRRFGKLPPRFENYQAIKAEPLWPLPAEETNDRSVLFLVSSLPMGGACRFILDVAGQLKSRGFRVTVATTAYLTNNSWLEELLKIVPDVFVLTHSRPVELPRLIAHLARTRKCGRVIVSHTMLGYQLLPWLRSELPGASFMDFTHIEYETEWPNGGYALRSLGNQPLLDLSMVSTEHLRHWMVTRGARAEGLRVCPTNIDTEKWTPNPEARARDRQELGIDERTAVILYPCRVTEQKRPELMCQIVSELRRATQAPFVVLAAGDGPLMPALRNSVEKQGLEGCVRLLGAISLERVARLHNASDIFLLPSLIEGVALALFEAMALESVPVAADVGGQREVVTPACGHLIPVGDAECELAAYVHVLKLLLEDPEQRRRQGCASRARVQAHFRINQMTMIFIASMHEAGTRLRRRQVKLPDAVVCRELATLAVDHIRLLHESELARDHGLLLHERLAKQEKLIAKLQRQIENGETNGVLSGEGERHY